MRCGLGHAETQASRFDPGGGEGALGGVCGWSVFAVLSNTFAQSASAGQRSWMRVQVQTLDEKY